MSNINHIKPNPNIRYPRKTTRKINVGGVEIGGNSAISVQSMTKTKTADITATVAQIARCKEAGADIIRVTVNDKTAAEAIKEIVRLSPLPIVADIHFNHIFAIEAIEAGCAKIRINPGNIGAKSRIKAVLDKAKEREIPIRIGVNSGSLEKDILERHGYPTAEALYESAVRHIEIANDFGFDSLAISVKSTSVPLMIEAYRLLSDKTDYPLHLGVTEAGTYRAGTVKSAIGIGALLSEGIGDTIRVSLTEEPELEVEIGKEILRSLGLKQRGIEIVSCPTCGRLEIDLFSIVKQIEDRTKKINKNASIAVLGCAVNGPGEASEADLGIAAGKGSALLYRKGEYVRKIKEDEIIAVILEELEKL
jgi:(E)-4-hydroxy-3-methylbut-2-enyl-diphosphate synthase